MVRGGRGKRAKQGDEWDTYSDKACSELCGMSAYVKPYNSDTCSHRFPPIAHLPSSLLSHSIDLSQNGHDMTTSKFATLTHRIKAGRSQTIRRGAIHDIRGGERPSKDGVVPCRIEQPCHRTGAVLCGAPHTVLPFDGRKRPARVMAQKLQRTNNKVLMG